MQLSRRPKIIMKNNFALYITHAAIGITKKNNGQSNIILYIHWRDGKSLHYSASRRFICEAKLQFIHICNEYNGKFIIQLRIYILLKFNLFFLTSKIHTSRRA